MDRYQYLIVMGLCVLVTLPLEVFLGARVYRDPRRWVRSVLPVIALFYVWDAVAIARGHWWFNPRYTTGVTLPFGVPVEELVFFVVVPTCALLSFDAIRSLLRRDVARPAVLTGGSS
jgi:lycopene beta-cyclase